MEPSGRVKGSRGVRCFLPAKVGETEQGVNEVGGQVAPPHPPFPESTSAGEGSEERGRRGRC